MTKWVFTALVHNGRIGFIFVPTTLDSTRSAYHSGWHRYMNFCRGSNIDPLPLREDVLCQFVASLSLSVGWQTILSYLSALRYFNISAGLEDPALHSFPRLSYVLRGVHRLTPQHSRPRRLPITPSILEALHAVWSQGPCNFEDHMLWAACCLGYFGFLRAGEFTCVGSSHVNDPISLEDISVDSRDNPQVLAVHLRHSKTDPFGAGCHIFLGRTGHLLCPVASVLGYLAIRPSTSGPLFIHGDGTPLTRS